MSENKRVKPGELADAISGIIQTYSDEVVDALPDIVKEISKETVKDLQKRASVFKGNGKYKKSFKSKKIASASRSGTSYTIYSDEYWLTHLLEYGHASANQYGRYNKIVAGTPHWEPAEKNAVQKLQQKIEEAIEGK